MIGRNLLSTLWVLNQVFDGAPGRNEEYNYCDAFIRKRFTRIIISVRNLALTFVIIKIADFLDTLMKHVPSNAESESLPRWDDNW